MTVIKRNEKGQIVSIDPDEAKEYRSKGGKAKVKKGLAMKSPEERRAIALKGVAARKAKRERN